MSRSNRVFLFVTALLSIMAATRVTSTAVYNAADSPLIPATSLHRSADHYDQTPNVARSTLNTPTPAPSPTYCPVATPEPLWVEPVLSPTDQLTQTVVVNIGNGEAVTVTTASGVFTTTGNFGAAGNPALVPIDLLPGITHDLTVAAYVRATNSGGCPFGGYTLTTRQDRNGDALRIVQQGDAVQQGYLPLIERSAAVSMPTLTPLPTSLDNRFSIPEN